MMNKRAFAALAAAISLAGGAGANHAKDAAPAGSPYAPYAFLIGEWEVVPADGGKPIGVSRFEWGRNKSYIWHEIATYSPEGEETPHLEGAFMWNGVNKNLDMLIMLDFENGRIAEQGTLTVGAEGEAIREVNAIYSEGVPMAGGGKVGSEGLKRRFRQTYKQVSPDRILTSTMRETPEGWVPTFPGSDKLAYVRKKK